MLLDNKGVCLLEVHLNSRLDCSFSILVARQNLVLKEYPCTLYWAAHGPWYLVAYKLGEQSLFCKSSQGTSVQSNKHWVAIGNLHNYIVQAWATTFLFSRKMAQILAYNFGPKGLQRIFVQQQSYPHPKWESPPWDTSDTYFMWYITFIWTVNLTF